MDLRSYAVLGSLAENLVSVFHCKESCIAEDINIVCESFCSHSREHFVAYQIYIFGLAASVGPSDCMCSKEIGFYRNGSSFLDSTDDT